MPFPRVMPSDLEMLLSSSPPLFVQRHGPFSEFRFGAPLNQKRKFLSLSTTACLNAANLTPIRPCLILKDDSTKDHKKRVWFADDKGLALTHVKIMSEPSNCPPRWTDDFLDYITNGIKALPVSKTVWEVNFPQPASYYLDFHRRLERESVTLENVVVQDDKVSGTVKVRNLSFHKEVFLRFTFDRWVSHQDFPTEYVSSGFDTATPYDTFKFNVDIPVSATKFGVLEFCVGFRCDEQEYWDNNGGKNYRLTMVVSKNLPPKQGKFTDALKADLDHWTEFASWHHLVNDSPYW